MRAWRHARLQTALWAVCAAAWIAASPSSAEAPNARSSALRAIDDESLTDRPVTEVVLQGINRVTEQEIRNNMRVAAGQPFDASAVKDDIATLYRLGHFDAVSADAELLDDGTVRVRYILVEQPIVRDIQVVGNKVVSDQELRGVISLYPGGPRDDFLLERAVEKIRNLYRSKGNYLVDVEVDESRLVETGILIFRIVEGPRVRIREIVFSGNQRFDTNQLGAQIKTKPWVFIFSMGNLDEPQLIDDVAALDKFYKDRGFIDVRVDKRVEISDDGKEAKVVFLVAEGRQYRLRSVSIEAADGTPEGKPRVIHAEQLLGLMTIRPGDAFTEDKLASSVEALKRAYEGVETHKTPHAGDVEVVFHTYFGFLGGGYQSEHHAFLPASHAETLLRRLHSFNLRWGWFCPGGLFVPFLSYASYRRQLKSIRAQAHAS